MTTSPSALEAQRFFESSIVAPIDGGALPGLTVPNPFAAARIHPPESWLRAVG